MHKPASRRAIFASAMLFLVLVSRPTFAQPTDPQIPPQLGFLQSLGHVRKTIYYEIWGEMKFPPGGSFKRGQHWTLDLDLKPYTDYGTNWAAMKPTFLKNGWKVVNASTVANGPFKEFSPASGVVTLTSIRNGAEAWLLVDMDPTVKIDMVLVGPVPIKLTLKEPAATPEKVDTAKDDFPYLAPMPGSRFHKNSQDPGPFWVAPKGGSQREMVAPGSLIRIYDFPALSNLLFMTVYRDALTKAGWDIVEDFMGADAMLTAHYARNGRNIWARLHGGGSGYDIVVADTGNDLNTRLAKDCHVALYGVLFDFNKATLQPASDAVLQQVANLLVANKTLKLEVQGHTDNVGNDAYNQKLSEDRAHSVVVWLTAHGVAAARLASKGFGKTMPVADNSTEAGRAKNRRVEIADPRCAAKTPMNTRK